MPDRIHLAANNPDVGGGEQMLLRHAEALQELGHPVTVVAPDSPSDVLDASRALGVDVAPIRAADRPAYLGRLRSWDRAERHGLLWCHGLIPAFATAGHRRRIVHLHQLPRTRAQSVASAVARRKALAVLVPSHDSAGRLAGSVAHPNWTEDLPLLGGDERADLTVGYLGRLSTDKGVDVLAHAVGDLPDVRLLLAGDTRHVDEAAVAVVEAALAPLGDRVARLGHVPPADLFRQVGVVVFPSVWAEPFGLVVAEAMAAGVPFVISDAGALPEVAGGDHPWVSRAGDVADLARAIRLALTASPDQAADVTARARRRWETEYSPAAGRARVRRLLDDLGVR